MINWRMQWEIGGECSDWREKVVNPASGGSDVETDRYKDREQNDVSIF